MSGHKRRVRSQLGVDANQGWELRQIHSEAVKSCSQIIHSILHEIKYQKPHS
jgi:hypothetical protein